MIKFMWFYIKTRIEMYKKIKKLKRENNDNDPYIYK